VEILIISSVPFAAASRLTKLLVRLGGLVQRDVVRDNKTGLSSSSDDEISELSVVCLDVALTSSEAQTLLEELAEWQGDNTLSRGRVWRTRVARYVEAWNSKSTSRSYISSISLLSPQAVGDGLTGDSDKVR